MHRRLVTAAAESHVERETRVFLVFRERSAAEAHTDRDRRLCRGRDLKISYPVENVETRLRELFDIFVSENEQITVLFGLSYNSSDRLRPFRQRVVDDRHRRRFFALLRDLEQLVVVVNENMRDNGSLLVVFDLQLLVIGYVKEVKNGEFSASDRAFIRYNGEIFRRERDLEGTF